MKAANVMVTNVISVGPETSVQDVAHILLTNRIITRACFDDSVAAMIASIRRVPALIIEAAVDGRTSDETPPTAV